MSSRCDGCRQTFRKVPLGPMLLTTTWRKIAAQQETLCLECIVDRAIERKIVLSLRTLRPCPFNLLHWPLSYFNFFNSLNSTKRRGPLGRKILNQWRAEARKSRNWPEVPSRLWAKL
jgi:hypothetical protein